jgi:hypothetical protein
VVRSVFEVEIRVCHLCGIRSTGHFARGTNETSQELLNITLGGSRYILSTVHVEMCTVGFPDRVGWVLCCAEITVSKAVYPTFFSMV